jgi:hypothetical protein
VLDAELAAANREYLSVLERREGDLAGRAVVRVHGVRAGCRYSRESEK